jgi:ubiquinone/menaquinone biosynthesis C-methylase UbiE
MNTRYDQIIQVNIAHFGAEAPYYSNAELWDTERAILKTIKPFSKILDAGCGAGRVSIPAAEMGFNVTGIDICQNSINAAKQIAAKQKVKAKFVAGDITNLPFEDESFDHALCPRYVINAVPLFHKRREAILELLRVTKRGGEVYMLFFNKFTTKKFGYFIFKNIISDIYLFLDKIFGNRLDWEYGDYFYEANKIKGAPIGFGHLTPIFEIRELLKGLNYQIVSEEEICGKGDWISSISKFFKYGIWVKISKPN